MDSILSQEREALLNDTRAVLSDLREMLATTGAGESERSALADSILQLDKLFLLVVAGEFNSGKSAFINALIGQKIQVEGVTPTTNKIHVLEYGEATENRPGPQGTWLQTAPVPLLRNTHIVDTPGTNAVLREHEMLTTKFIPRSDLVIFITSADRPFTESERAFLDLIRSWGKKIVLVVNKIDILSQDEIEKVLEFVKSASNKLMGETPPVFAVSSKRAQAVKIEKDVSAAASGFEALEAFIQKSLDDVGRFRLKLLNPLGVGHKLVRQQLEICRVDLDSLAEDLTLLDNIQRQMEVYSEDMLRNFKARLEEIKTLLNEMERRGVEFFNQTIRIGRIFELMNRSKIEIGFERQVVADTPQKLESRVSELIDWLIEQDLRQWASIADHLRKRQQQHESRIVGQTGPQEGTLAYDRQRLIDSIGLATRRAISTYKKEKEAERIAESVREAVIQTGLIGLGGAGLGVALAVLLHTAWADMTGIVTGTAAVAFGFFILPSRRQKAKKHLAEKLEALRDKLMAGLNEQFDRELRRTIRRLEDVAAPYKRFVRAEQNNILSRRDRLNELGSRIAGMLDQISQLKS